MNVEIRPLNPITAIISSETVTVEVSLAPAAQIVVSDTGWQNPMSESIDPGDLTVAFENGLI